MSAQAHASAAGTIDLGDGLMVNRIGFGTTRITGRDIWGDPPDRDRAVATLRRAIELGVNFIDTADSYGPGTSENLIAAALHPYPDDLVIATKAGYRRPGPKLEEWFPDGRPDHLRAACEGSLRRLKLEQIGLYQLHCPDPAVPIAESVGALAEMKTEGKIRHIGLSNVTADELREARQVAEIVSVQNRYNAADRQWQPMLDLCDRERLVFIPWAPVLQGNQNPAVGAAAARHGIGPQQVILAWLLASSPMMLPIPGTSCPAHAEENIAAAAVRLSAEEMIAISDGAPPS